MRTKKEKKIIKEELKKIEKVAIDIPEYYMLKYGETISDVAEKFGMTEEEINKLNNNATFVGGNQVKLK